MYKGLYDTTIGLSGQDRQDVGAMTARLMLTWPSWTHRRVETLQPADADVVRRSMSVDFSLPYWFHESRLPVEFRHGELRGSAEAERMLGERRRQLVPLAWLDKRLLMNFNLRDDSGDAVPLLNFDQNVQVAITVLEYLAQAVLGEERLDCALAAEFRQVAACRPDDWPRVSAELFETRDHAASQRATLAQNETFVAFADAFARSLLALAIVQLACHERRVVRFEYDQSPSLPEGSGWEETGRPLFRALASARDGLLGRSTPFYVVVSQPSEAASTHFEVAVPRALQLGACEVVVPGAEETLRPLAARVARSAGRVHLHVTETTSHESRPVLIVFPRPRPTSGSRGAAMVGILAVATLAWLATSLGAVQHQPEAITAVLLSFSALLTLFVVQNDSDGMTARVLFWVRLLGIAPGAAALGSAVYLIAVACQPGRQCATADARPLIVAAAFSGLAVSLLLWSWFHASRPKHFKVQ